MLLTRPLLVAIDFHGIKKKKQKQRQRQRKTKLKINTALEKLEGKSIMVEFSFSGELSLSNHVLQVLMFTYF